MFYLVGDGMKTKKCAEFGCEKLICNVSTYCCRHGQFYKIPSLIKRVTKTEEEKKISKIRANAKWSTKPGNKEKRSQLIRNWKLENRFGITLEEYNKRLLTQNGVCEICGNFETELSNAGKIKNLSVDHNHSTNKVRGLLCSNCNVALGLMKEDELRLQRMIDYIRKHK